MASSIAYIHAAIPLNVSIYQHHMSLDKLTNTPTSAQTPLAKSIKDMAFFAAKRLNKLANKLHTIDNVLPDDHLSQTLNSRQKCFIDFLFAPALSYKALKLPRQSLTLIATLKTTNNCPILFT